MYGEIVLDRDNWFLVKWYNTPTVLHKYYKGTKEAIAAIYQIVATDLNRRVK